MSVLPYNFNARIHKVVKEFSSRKNDKVSRKRCPQSMSARAI